MQLNMSNMQKFVRLIALGIVERWSRFFGQLNPIL